jgi:mannose-6-phosphate isomerase-like protein (cupin superfamily)
MAEGKVINSWEVKSLILDDSYSSKMLLDDVVAGTKTININEGTLKGGHRTYGGVHDKNEIYYIVNGEAVLHLDEDVYNIKPGSVAFIPAGVFHYIDNKSKTEDFVILTFWENANDNEVYNVRLKEWGKSFKTIYED